MNERILIIEDDQQIKNCFNAVYPTKATPWTLPPMDAWA